MRTSSGSSSEGNQVYYSFSADGDIDIEGVMKGGLRKHLGPRTRRLPSLSAQRWALSDPLHKAHRRGVRAREWRPTGLHLSQGGWRGSVLLSTQRGRGSAPHLPSALVTGVSSGARPRSHLLGQEGGIRSQVPSTDPPGSRRVGMGVTAGGSWGAVRWGSALHNPGGPRLLMAFPGTPCHGEQGLLQVVVCDRLESLRMKKGRRKREEKTWASDGPTSQGAAGMAGGGSGQLVPVLLPFPDL